MDEQRDKLLLFLVFLANVGFGAFAIYFVFKVLGFFINATRLYRRMVRRQDAMIELLIDVRDNTKVADVSNLDATYDNGSEDVSTYDRDLYDPDIVDSDDDEEESADPDVCYQCGEQLKAPTSRCPSCGKELK